MLSMIVYVIFACGTKETQTIRTDSENINTQDTEEIENTEDSAVQVDTSELDSETDTDTEETEEPCPENMVLINQSFCIDKYEATLEENINGSWQAASPYQTIENREVRAVVSMGMVPQAHISGEQAQAACQESGKRLCSSEEWLRACQGASGNVYPYGNSYWSGACNDHYNGHPLVNYYGTSEGIWDSAHMNNSGINQQSGTVSEGGAFLQCVSEDGVYDMHGNLHEWVEDPSGIFRGGFYADASINGEGCSYRTTAHGFGYFDYSTGFRCCAEVN